MKHENNLDSGLYIVATPIGCLTDLSMRAIEILKHVDLVLAEDTRHSQRLLEHYHVTTRMQSMHQFNEQEKAQSVIASLQSGQSMALISDAGTPLISDPGCPLVALCHQYGIPVRPVPGPCALIAAISVAGLASDGFTFLGFLPAKKSGRIDVFKQYQSLPHMFAFYEAPHRILACLQDLLAVFGPQREICIARELTKRYETIKRGQIEAMITFISNDSHQIKGEFVVMVDRAPACEPDEQEARRVYAILAAQMSHKDAVRATHDITGVAKNTIYPWSSNK